MRQSGRRIALLAGPILVSSLVVGCGGSDSSGGGGGGLEKKTITVSSLPLADCAGMHIALKQKFFEAEGLKVVVKPIQKSIQALPALKSGEVDVIGCGNYVSFFSANDSGALKLRILNEATTLKPNVMSVVALPDSKLTTAKDLEGKKVAVNILRNIQPLTLNAILKANNVDASKVTYVEIAFPLMAAALEKKQVDAIHVVEPFLSDIQKKLGAKVVVNGASEPVLDIPVSAYVTNEEFTTKNPKTAAAFQRAIVKAQQMAATDRKRIEEVLPGYAHIEPSVASTIALPGFPSSMNTTRVQRIVDLMTSASLLKSKPDLNTILYQPKS